MRDISDFFNDLEISKIVSQNLKEDTVQLAKKLSKLPIDYRLYILSQIHSYQKASKKFNKEIASKLIYPSTDSVEMASSLATAKFKSNFANGGIGADVTGGLGIDAMSFAKKFKKFYFVDIDSDVCKIAKQNFTNLGIDNIEVINDDALSFIIGNNELDFVYADPKRRNDGSKAIKFDSYSPNPIKLYNLCREKGINLMIKFSPMADISELKAKFSHLDKIISIESKNELKEILIEIDFNKTSVGNENIFYDADSNLTISLQDEDVKNPIILNKEIEVGQYLWEPSPALLKFGLYDELSIKYNLFKIARSSNLFVSENPVNLPGKIFIINKVGTTKDKFILENSSEGASIISRNYVRKPEEIRNEFKIKENETKFLVFTQNVQKKYLCLVCDRITKKIND